MWIPIKDAPRDGRLAWVYRPLAKNVGLPLIIQAQLLARDDWPVWDCTVPHGMRATNPTSSTCHVSHYCIQDEMPDCVPVIV